ncbi:hypothetical protein [Aquimarina mytili]|uniref:Uncharacterized protein n=1 Tax=Aquimarina mytili TaxID=874423 RepID=A0A936ZUX0_9FLAO|nr:hypothetical protein [Aquimarina mytili]MBL0686039.1 hypothetical protein [Aquimarina mytili]
MKKNYDPESIEWKRNMDQMGLATYMDELDINLLEAPTKGLIKSLNENLENEYQDAGESFMETGSYDLVNANYLEQQLMAVYEVKIIHLYKSLEINVKRLLKAAYNKTSKDLYRWSTLTGFLNSKEIDYKKIKGYVEVNQLREVNNTLKHWTREGDSKIGHIEEFKEVDGYSEESLRKFYTRIRNFPIQWLLGLRDAIYEELYEFSDDRLENLAKEFALRMDPQVMERFIKKLKDKY